MMASGQNGMGGAATPQAGAPNTNLQNLFMQNAPTNPAGGGAQLPQITAPARPAMPSMPSAPQLPQTGGSGFTLPSFGNMSGAQRFGVMMGAKFNPSTGKMDLPENLDRDSAIAARNVSKAAINSGQQNPYGRNHFNFRGGSR